MSGIVLTLMSCDDDSEPRSAACSVQANRDGTATIVCQDGSHATIGSPAPRSHARRHVIVFLADGMGLPHQIAASQCGQKL